MLFYYSGKITSKCSFFCFDCRAGKVDVGDASRVKVDGGTLAEGRTQQDNTLTAFSHEYIIALCPLCSDEDYANQGVKAMREDLLDKELKLKIEYKVGGQEYVSFVDSFAVAVSGKDRPIQAENIKRLQEAFSITEIDSQCRLMFKMPGISCSGSSC